MVDPIPVADLKRRLVDSGVLSTEELQTAESSTRTESNSGHAFLEFLVQAGTLTSYQAKCLLDDQVGLLSVGNYVIVEPIGAGGMGQVYRARHQTTGQQVAIKVLPKHRRQSPEAVKRFEREIELARKLDHPAVAKVLDGAADARSPWYAMEYVEGSDLQRHVEQHGPLELDVAADYVMQSARGLAYLHAKGVIHRDIKPANLILATDETVKLVDFGLARLDPDSTEDSVEHFTMLTETGAAMGSVDYMAPEQAHDARSVDHRADLYSLGCTLYFLVNGKPPYRGETEVETLLAHSEGNVPRLSNERSPRARRFNRLLQRLMAPQLARRYASADELTADLKSAIDASASDSKRRWAMALGVPIILCVIAWVAYCAAARSTTLTLESTQTTSPTAESPSLSATPSTTFESIPATPVTPKAATAIWVGMETGMEPTLADAFVAAGAGNVIEIHTNEPLVIEPELTWDKGPLTIRAGDGFSPVIVRQDGVPGRLLGFYPPNADDEIRLEGLTILNVSEQQPLQHYAIACQGAMVMERCTFITYSGGVFFENDAEQTATITDCYLAAYGSDAGYWDTVRLPSGRLTLDNNLWTGHPKINVSDQGGPVTKLIARRNSIVNGQPWYISGPTKMDLRDNLVIASGLAHVAAASVDSFEALGSLLDYSGNRNLFHRTPFKVTWQGTGQTLNESSDNLAKWQELTGNREVDPLLFDPSFVHPEALQFASHFLLPARFFGISPDVPETEQGVGVDLERLPPLTDDLFTLLPASVFKSEVVAALDGDQDALAEAEPLTIPFSATDAFLSQRRWSAKLQVPTELVTSIGLKLRLIPPGEFTFVRLEKNVDASEPIQIQLSKAFYAGVTEVTVEHFRYFVEATGYVTEAERIGGAHQWIREESRFTIDAGKSWRDPGYPQQGDHPVVCVSWNDARAFCQWLSEKEGRLFCLPTEAQWEWAGRAGTATERYFDDVSGRVEHYVIDGDTASVTSTLPNAWGLHGILGNGLEWQADDASYYRGDLLIDPHTIGSDTLRIRRGYTTIRTRYGMGTAFSVVALGFRVISPVDWRNSEEELLKDAWKVASELQDQAAKESGVPVTYQNSLGMTFQFIPAGEVVVDRDRSLDRDIEKIVPVPLSSRRPFYLGRTEVTVAQFREFIDATKYATTAEENPAHVLRYDPGGKLVQADLNWLDPGYLLHDDLPVTMVSRIDSERFCQWLSEKEGRQYRLPSEVEWEYACRARTSTPRFLARRDVLSDYGYLRAQPPDYAPISVGLLKPNPWGLLDVYGNVHEWCRPNAVPGDDASTETAERVRGGGWWSPRDAARSSSRSSVATPERACDAIGFRVLLEIEGENE